MGAPCFRNYFKYLDYFYHHTEAAVNIKRGGLTTVKQLLDFLCYILYFLYIFIDKEVTMLPNMVEINELLSTGAQPDIEGLKELKSDGYTAVLNLSPTSTPNFVPAEGSEAEKLGFKYVHYPVDCSTLKEDLFTVFAGIMDGLKEEKTFVHCGGNIKSSGFVHIYQVLVQNRDEAESFSDLLKAQTPDEKWLAYFSSFGLKVPAAV